MSGRRSLPRLFCLLLLAIATVGQAQDATKLPTEIGGYRLLYVPAENLDTVLQRDRRGVFLAQDEFRKLVEAARVNADATANRPAVIVIASADYKGELRDEQLVLTVTAKLENTVAGWADLVIPLDGLSIESVQLDGGPAPITRDPANTNLLHVFIEKPGPHALTLALSAPLVAVGGDRAVGFSLLPSASATMSVPVPANRFLTVDGLQLKRPVANDQPAEYAFALGGKPRVQLQFTGQQAGERVDALTLANTAFGVRVTPGDVAWTARTHLQVFGRPINRLVCRVPRKLEITGVESTGLEAWELTDTPDDPETTTITLNYRQPLEGSRDIAFRGVVKVEPGQPWDVPGLELEGVASHVGIVRVEHPPGVRVRMEKGVGVRQMTQDDASKAQAVAVPGDQSIAFQVWKPDFNLTFTTESKAREVQAAVTNLLSVTDAGLDLTMVGTIETRFAPLFDVLVSVPAAWQILATQIDGQPVDYQILPNEAGTQLIRLPLTPPLPPGQTRTVQVAIRNIPEVWPLEEGAQRLPLPEVKLPQAGVVEGLYGITAHSGLEVVPMEFQGLDSGKPTDMDLLRQKLGPLAADLRHGFTYQDGQLAGQLETTRKPPRLAVSSRTWLRIDPASVFARIEADLAIEGGGVRKLTLTLPESTGTDLRFQVVCGPVQAPTAAVPIIEQTSTAPANGVRTWFLRFDRFLVGPHTLAVDVRTPKTDNVVTAPALHIAGAERENGHLAIEADEDQFLTPQAVDAASRALPIVDPVDVPPGLYTPQKRIVAAYFADRGGWQVGVREQRFARSEIPTAVVHEARLSTVIGEEGEWQHQAEVHYTAVGIQAFKIRIADADLWAATIDDRAVEVRRQGDEFQIPHDGKAGDAKHTLRLVYSTAQAESVRSSAGEIRQRPPAIRVVDGAGNEQALEVLQQTWTLHYPQDLILTNSLGTFRPQARLRSGGWIDSTWLALRSSNPRDLTQMGIVAAIIFGLAFVLRWLIGKTQDVEVRWKPLAIAGACCIVLFACLVFFLPIGGMAPMRSESMTRSQVGSVTDGSWFDAPPAAGEPRSWAAPRGVSGLDADADMDGLSPGEAASIASTPQAESPVSPPPAPDAPPKPGADPALSDAEPRTSPMRKSGEKTPEDRADFGSRKPTIKSIPDIRAIDNLNGVVDQKAKSEIDLEMLVEQSKEELKANDASGLEKELSRESVEKEQLRDESRRTNEEFDRRLETSQLAYSKNAGLLSLNASVLVPDDSQSTQFRHQGEDGIGQPTDAPALDVKFRRAEAGRSRVWVIAAAVLLATWFLRSHRKTLWLALVLLAILSLSLAPILPATIQYVPDGFLFGAGAGMGLLLLLEGCRLCGCCRTSWPLPGGTSRALVLLTVSLMGSTAFAQPKAVEADVQYLAQPRAVERDVDRETLIVPYDGEDPLTSFRVFLPHDTYLKLYRLANPEDGPQPQAPVEASIAEALYAIALQPAAPTPTALVKARFLVESFRDQQVRIPLPFEGVALKSAQLDGQSAPLVMDAARPALLVKTPGRHVLDVEFEVAVETTGPAGRMPLKLHPSPAAKLTFELPAPDLEFRLNGTTGLFRKRSEDGKTFIEAPVDAGGDIALAWQPKQMRGIDTAIVQVDSTILAAFDDAGLLSSHGFVVGVRQGAITELNLSIPAGYSLQQITGGDVGGWQIEAADAGQTLKVFFRQPIDRETRLRVDLFRAISADQAEEVVLPEVIPQGVSREVGQIGVYASEPFGIRAGDAAGLTQIDVAKFVPIADVRKPEETPRLAYRFSSRPAKLTVVPFRRQPETTVTAEHGIYVGLRKQLVASVFRYVFAGAPRASVSFQLPAGYLPIDVEAGDILSDWYVSPAAQDGQSILTIEFTAPRTGNAEITLQGRITSQGEAAIVPASVPRPLELTRATTVLGVWFDDVFAASVRDLPAAWRSIPSEQAPPRLKQLQPRPVQFAFRSTGVDLPALTFDVSRNVPQLSGDSITLIAVSDTSVDYGVTLRWRISRAGTDTFQFVTPPSLEGRLQFKDARIRQAVSSRVDGSIRWTVVLNEPVRDEYLLSAVATLPPSADEIVQFPTLVQEQPNVTAAVVPLETQRHFGVLVNLSSRQLATVNPADVVNVTRAELPFKIDDALLQQAMEVIELARGAKSPQWKSQRAEEVQGTLATVTGTEIVTVFNHDGSWRTRAEYTIRSRGQQFLGLRLPIGSRILSAIVKDRPARTVRTQLGADDVHLVPLPATSVSDLSLKLSLILAGNVGGPFSDSVNPRAQSFDLPAPQVVSRTDSAEFGMTVAQTLWTVYVPDDFRVTPIVDPSRTNVLPEESEDFAVTTELLGAQRQLADVLDLIRVSTSAKTSTFQKYNSTNNLKQIGQSLQYYEQGVNRYDGQNRQRYLDFIEGNREVIEQAQQAAQNQPTDAGVQINAQQFITDNTLQLNFSNSAGPAESKGGSVPAEGDHFFRFVKPQAASGKKMSGDNARGKLRGQIANQSQTDLNAYPQSGSGFSQPSFGTPVLGTPIGRPGPPHLPQQAGGRGGAMGGGFGADIAPLMDELAESPSPPKNKGWESAGGLSLKFELPTSGQKLHFSKVGGNPKLAIAARPQRTWTFVFAALWVALGLLAALAIVRVARRPDGSARLLDLAPVVLALVGAACYLLLPDDQRLIGILIWIAVALWIVSTAFRRRAAL